MSLSAAGTTSTATRVSGDRAGVRASNSGVRLERGERGYDEGRTVRIKLARTFANRRAASRGRGRRGADPRSPETDRPDRATDPAAPGAPPAACVTTPTRKAGSQSTAAQNACADAECVYRPARRSWANGVGARRHWRCSSTKRIPTVWPVASRCVSSRESICATRVALSWRVSRRRDRHEHLLSNRLITGLDATLIVASPGRQKQASSK